MVDNLDFGKFKVDKLQDGNMGSGKVFVAKVALKKTIETPHSFLGKFWVRSLTQKKNETPLRFVHVVLRHCKQRCFCYACFLGCCKNIVNTNVLARFFGFEGEKTSLIAVLCSWLAYKIM